MDHSDWINKPNSRHETVDWYAVFPQVSKTTREEVDTVISEALQSLGITKGNGHHESCYKLPGGTMIKHNHFTAQLDRYRYALRTSWWISPAIAWDDIPVLYQLHTITKDNVPQFYGDFIDISDGGASQRYESTTVRDGFGTGGLSDTKGT